MVSPLGAITSHRRWLASLLPHRRRALSVPMPKGPSPSSEAVTWSTGGGSPPRSYSSPRGCGRRSAKTPCIWRCCLWRYRRGRLAPTGAPPLLQRFLNRHLNRVMHNNASRLPSYKGYDAAKAACGAPTLGSPKPTHKNALHLVLLQNAEAITRVPRANAHPNMLASRVHGL